MSNTIPLLELYVQERRRWQRANLKPQRMSCSRTSAGCFSLTVASPTTEADNTGITEHVVFCDVSLGSGLASSFLITEQSKRHRLPWTQGRLEITWGSTGRLISLIAQRNEISFLSMLWVWRNSTLSWNLPGLDAECMQCVCLCNVFSKVIYFCFLFFFPPFSFSTRKKHHSPMLHFGLQGKETWLSSSCCWTVGE